MKSRIGAAALMVAISAAALMVAIGSGGADAQSLKDRLGGIRSL
jgi:hypothetical protein